MYLYLLKFVLHFIGKFHMLFSSLLHRTDICKKARAIEILLLNYILSGFRILCFIFQVPWQQSQTGWFWFLYTVQYFSPWCFNILVNVCRISIDMFYVIYIFCYSIKTFCYFCNNFLWLYLLCFPLCFTLLFELFRAIASAAL